MTGTTGGVVERVKTPAEIILEQLGGGRFAAMTGAGKFLSSDEGRTLSFRIPGARGFTREGINSVRITLDPSDTYTVEFGRVRGAKFTVVETLSDVYNDMLRDVFERVTGLRTSL